MVDTGKGGIMHIAKQLHIGMVHTITQLAFFFKGLLSRIVAIVAVLCMNAFGNVVLVGKYHNLPCYKTE
jgi:hypothetical protein